MGFEHFEGVNPDQQFDRLGKKGDMDFLPKKLSEDVDGKTEKLSYRGERVESLKTKIAELKEALLTREDEGKIISPGFLLDTSLELKDKELELQVLQAQIEKTENKKNVDKDLSNDLNKKVFQN
jgi:hypothetical protein